MPWDTSSRRSTLPANWQQIRRQILARDKGVCQIAGPHCTVRATEVDHTAGPEDHRLEVLRAACRACHGRISSSQGHAAQATIRARGRRQPERHPGLL